MSHSLHPGDVIVANLCQDTFERYNRTHVFRQLGDDYEWFMPDGQLLLFLGAAPTRVQGDRLVFLHPTLGMLCVHDSHLLENTSLVVRRISREEAPCHDP